MIDWVEFTFPLAHDLGTDSPFFAGQVMSTKSDGEVDWIIGKRKQFVGSHSSVIQVRSGNMPDGRQAVWVSGNLVKFFQGHNVFGTGNMRHLIMAAIRTILDLTGITPLEDDRNSWLLGDIKIHRVDVTESVSFGTEQRVLNALRSLDQTASLKMRGRGMYNGHSLLFGKGSRNWSLTLYSKGTELRKHDKLPHELRDGPLLPFADGLLRMEFRLRAMHLKKLHLSTLANWGCDDRMASVVHQMMLQNLDISDTTMLDSNVLDALPGPLKGVYQLYSDGYDLRSMYAKNTFYRYRRAFLVHGIDISIKQERKQEPTNVVPLKVVLVGTPVGIPDWARNTSLYFEPSMPQFATREAA